MRTIARTVALVAVLGLIGAACSSGPSGPTTVAIGAEEFSFDGPTELSSGTVRFEMTNNGQQPHHLTVLKLADGGDADACLASEGNGDSCTVVGGVQAVDPTLSANGYVDLDEGTYLFACFVPDLTGDGAPHHSKGMLETVTVTGEAASTMPEGDLTIAAKDFMFDVPALEAGEHTIAFDNQGTQSHEWVLVQFAEGKALPDLFAFFADPSAGPPPASFVGGGAVVSAGETIASDVTFESGGSYAFVCFLLDPASEKLHVELGMAAPFAVA